jgi:hypothetical protein
VEQKEWGEAVKITANPTNRNEPRFWGAACTPESSLLKKGEIYQSTMDKEPQMVRLSLLDTLEVELHEAKSPVEFDILDKEHIRWFWRENMSDKQKFSQLSLVLVPTLEEGLKSFKETLKGKGNHTKNMTNPSEVLSSTRLKFFQNCLDKLNETIKKHFPHSSNPSADWQKNLPEVEYLVGWAFTIAHNTEAIFPIEDKLENEADAALTPFPILMDLTQNPADEEYADTRTRDWTTLEEKINAEIPDAFNLTRNARGKTEITNSEEWQEACKPGNERLLIWDIENAILPAIMAGFTNFGKKIDPEARQLKDLQKSIISPATMNAFREAIERIEENVMIAKDHLQGSNPGNTEKSFREQLKLRRDLKWEIQNGISNNASESKIILLHQTLAGIKEEMRKKDPSAVEATIRTYLLQNLSQLLTIISRIKHKKTRPQWEIEPEDPLKGATAIHFPQLVNDVAGILNIPDFSRGFASLATEDLADEA